MIVICEKCKQTYDDVYHFTYCPHDFFMMRTIVYKNGKEYICTSLEEYDKVMKL